jgi:dTDP-L-rhamnose 4-epimerase
MESVDMIISTFDNPVKVLITGGAGFIGKWLVRRLPSNVEIVIVDSLDPQVHRTQTDFSQELQERATCLKADIRDPSSYLVLLEGADVIVHLASQTGTGQSMYEISRYVQHNVDGTAKLLEAISTLQHKPKRIILASSRAVYGDGAFVSGSDIHYSRGRRLEDLTAGKWEVYDDQGNELLPLPMREHDLTNPTSIYGLTKLWQEQLIENYAKNQGIDYALFRLQNVYGPEQELHNPYTGIVGIFTSLIMETGQIELFEDGKMTRDFVYVQDVADAIVKSIYHPENISQIINVGSGEATTLEVLVNEIASAAQKQVSIRYSGRFRVGDIRHAVADVSRYKCLFKEDNFTPLQEGMQQYLSWYAQQNPLSSELLSSSFKEMESNNLLLRSK